jgi:putative membrane protein
MSFPAGGIEKFQVELGMLSILANLAYALVIALHVYFVILEMVLWKKRAGIVFKMPQEQVEATAKMASNQGLYNGFLVTALVIGFLAPDPSVAHAFIMYGLLCVIAAGIWGGITVNKRITLVQSVPALIALTLYLI